MQGSIAAQRENITGVITPSVNIVGSIAPGCVIYGEIGMARPIIIIDEPDEGDVE